MKNRKAKEIIFLLSPCIILMVLALFSNSLKEDSPFISRVLVDEVRLEPTPAGQKNYKAYKYTVYVSYRWRKPNWWDKGSDMQGFIRPRFIDRKGQEMLWHIYGAGPSFDKESQRYTIQGDTEIPIGFDMKQATFAGAIKGRNVGLIRFNLPVVID